MKRVAILFLYLGLLFECRVCGDKMGAPHDVTEDISVHGIIYADLQRFDEVLFRLLPLTNYFYHENNNLCVRTAGCEYDEILDAFVLVSSVTKSELILRLREESKSEDYVRTFSNTIDRETSNRIRRLFVYMIFND